MTASIPGRVPKIHVSRARAAGRKVEVGYNGDSSGAYFDELSTMGMHVVSRVVQEGLTNARKHAPGEKVDIEVALERDMVRVTMRNKKLAVATESSGGHGLVGLRERCRLTGGYLEIRDDEDFSWHLYLPLEKQ